MSKNSKIQLNKRLLVIAAVSLVVLLMTSVTAYAWFTNRRRLDTMTKINAPSTLVIGAGNKEDSINIDLGSIDVESGTNKYVVFCVYSDLSAQKYKVQLARTTNINFTYTIYQASESAADSGDAKYVDANGNSHYYTKGSALTGTYLNPNGTIAGNTLHDRSYGNYNYVQQNAEPLYWQSDEITEHTEDGTGFADYYILEVSWTEGYKPINKETDMVYITAGIV